MESSCLYALSVVWIYVFMLLPGTRAVSTQNIYSSGCSRERINLECPDFHKVAIKRLFYGIKNDTMCSRYGRKHSKDCCQPSHNDCHVVDDTKYPFLNMMCSGRPRCDIQAASFPSSMACRLRGYVDMTDYMSVIHDCIPDKDTLYLCSNSYKRGKLLYLSNENYPQPIRPGDQQCQCLIKTKNHVGIDIHALDVIITRSDTGNQCYQDIDIQDEEGHQKVISCGNPGLYAFRNIYNSDVRSVTLTLNSRSPQAQGYVWLQAKATNDDDFLEIYCGNEMKRHLGYPIDDAESRTIDNEGEEKEPPTLDESAVNLNQTGAATPNVVSDMMALIVGIAVAIAMIIIIGVIGIIILCLRRSQQPKRPVRAEPPPFPSPMLKSKEDNHTSNTYCHYDYDEDKYCSIKRSPMRFTKFNNMNADLKLKEAFSQGVQPTENHSPNGYMNYCEEMPELAANQHRPLLERKESKETDSEEEEVIMPRSEYIAFGKAIQPRSVPRDQQSSSLSLPEKKKGKNKTVTFSQVAMVTPLPSGSNESVPEDIQSEELKCQIMDMYSKTLPSRYASSPEKTRKGFESPVTQDDMCLTSFVSPGCENVTEEDLWEAFHIKLDDSVNEVHRKDIADEQDLIKYPEKQIVDDPDYDENPYDNLPYINVGSLRRKHGPPPPVPYKDPALKRHFTSQKPSVGTIPEVS